MCRWAEAAFLRFQYTWLQPRAIKCTVLGHFMAVSHVNKSNETFQFKQSGYSLAYIHTEVKRCVPGTIKLWWFSQYFCVIHVLCFPQMERNQLYGFWANRPSYVYHSHCMQLNFVDYVHFKTTASIYTYLSFASALLTIILGH